MCYTLYIPPLLYLSKISVSNFSRRIYDYNAIVIVDYIITKLIFIYTKRIDNLCDTIRYDYSKQYLKFSVAIFLPFLSGCKYTT